MKMTQNFTNDFETLVNALVAGKRFALIRFGDGESAILRNRERPFVTQRKGEDWHSDRILPEVTHAMHEAIQADLPGLYVATICPACSGQSSAPLRSLVRCPLERQTYAEIFGNANWGLLKSSLNLLRSRCFLVSSSPDADFRIPTNLPEQSFGEHLRIVDSLSKVTKPIALAAGPSATVLGHLYWAREGPKGQSCVDVGALFDPLSWGNTRHYMPEGSPRGQRVCTWDGAGVGLDTD